MNKITNSPEETIDYAKSIASSFKPGDIYGLRGEMASGKTTFIKGLLMGMKYKNMVNSPTFTLVNEYDAFNKVIHIDCYREQKLNRWLDIGIMDYLMGNNVVIIEWSEYIEKILPKNMIQINIDYISKFERKIKISL